MQFQVAERPGSGDGAAAFGYIANSMWCVIITMTTVGYGDLYPESYPGRFVVVMSAFAGTCIVAMLTSSTMENLQLSNTESKIEYLIVKSRLTARCKLDAIIVVQRYFRYRKKLKGPRTRSGRSVAKSQATTEADVAFFQVMASIRQWRRTCTEIQSCRIDNMRATNPSTIVLDRISRLEETIMGTRENDPPENGKSSSKPAISKSTIEDRLENIENNLELLVAEQKSNMVSIQRAQDQQHDKYQQLVLRLFAKISPAPFSPSLPSEDSQQSKQDMNRALKMKYLSLDPADIAK